MATRNKSRSTSGLRPFPRAKPKPVEEMSMDELLKFKKRNEDALRSPTASSSSYIERVQENQTKVLHRIAEFDGMDNIQRRLRRATISEDVPMEIADQPKPFQHKSRFQEVLRQSLQQSSQEANTGRRRTQKTLLIDFDEAIALDEKQYAIEQERRARAEARRLKSEKVTMPSRQDAPGRFKSQAEYDAAVWKFMNYKPSDSDMEAEGDDDFFEDPDDEDPATYFDDEEDDGIKGQNIVYPDAEDFSDVIRVDTNKVHYSTFYEPRDDS